MRVMGIDFSSRFVDCVKVPYEGTGAPEWHRFALTGNDAFDRARSVADAMPGRASTFYEDTLCVGIEHPAGHHGTGALLRVQGAILARIPARMLVHPLPPGKWRALVGLKGNASKDDVAAHFIDVIRETPEWRHHFTERPETWTQDACDAACIALATRKLLDEQKVA